MKKHTIFDNKYNKKSCKRGNYFVYLCMDHIQGISRNQLQMSSLDDKITNDNPVRFIDAFVKAIDLEKIGFQTKFFPKTWEEQCL